MELIEKIALDKIRYLNSLTENDLKPYLNKCKNAEERKKEMNKIKSFCLTNIKTKGITKRIYSKPDLTPTECDSRLYSGGSVQSLIKAVRTFLMGDITSDLDMENAHPKILSYICRKHGYLTPCLDYYIANRELILEQFACRNEGKTHFLRSLNTDTINKKVTNAFFKKFDKEMKEVQNTITKLPEYKTLVESVPKTKMFNTNGSAINRILCSYEDNILSTAISAVNRLNIEMAVLMFDGMMLYGSHGAELLSIIKTEVESQWEGLNMNWTFKDQEQSIFIPEDWSYQEETEKVEDVYNSMVEDFEKHTFLISNLAMYLTLDDDKIIFRTPAQLRISYGHISCGFDDKGNGVSFINKWLGINPSIKRYRDIDVFPDKENCPKDIYNMWRPFAYEKYTEPYERDQEGLDFILKHFAILTNNESSVTEYFINWTAQMIQYPAVKTNTPVMIGEEGTGKSTYFKMMGVLLGGDKIFETSRPSIDVWGQFNESLQNAFLVNLDELSKKETEGADGFLKTLITEPTLNINIKGTTKFKIKSFHRVAISSNNYNPLDTKKGDRRKWFIKCSSEKKGDKEYFKRFYSYLKSVNTMRTLYDYFKSIPDMDGFSDIAMPLTEFQQNIQESNRTSEDQWLEHFIHSYTGDEAVLQMTNDEVYAKYSIYCNASGMQYVSNRQTFCRNILNGNYGIKGKQLGNGDRVKIFDSPYIKTKYPLAL